MAACAVDHFRHEEHCFEQYHCPFAAENREAHQEFLKTFERIRADLREKGPTPLIAARIVRELDRWLITHVGQTDCKLRAVAPRAS